MKSPENAGQKVHIEALRKGFRRRRPAPETPAPELTEEVPAGEAAAE